MHWLRRYAYRYQLVVLLSTVFCTLTSVCSYVTSPARPMDSCPPPFHFSFSECASNVSTQAVGILCSDSPGGPPVYVQNDTCQERGEHCIGIGPWTTSHYEPFHAEHKAYCVPSRAFSEVGDRDRVVGDTEFSSIGTDLLITQTWFRIPQTDAWGSAEWLIHAQAQMMGRMTTKRLQAVSLALYSYMEDEVSGERVKRLTGASDCMNCSAVHLTPVQLGTNTLNAAVIARPEVAIWAGHI